MNTDLAKAQDMEMLRAQEIAAFLQTVELPERLHQALDAATKRGAFKAGWTEDYWTRGDERARWAEITDELWGPLRKLRERLEEAKEEAVVRMDFEQAAAFRNAKQFLDKAMLELAATYYAPGGPSAARPIAPTGGEP